MIDFPLLSLITFLPLVGAILVAGVRGSPSDVERSTKSVALFTSVCTFIASLLALWIFDPAKQGFQLTESVAWFPKMGLTYSMGVDGISLSFVLLSTFLTPICIAASWKSIKHRVKEYMFAFLLLETFMIGAFCALDMVLFYVLFEGVLIPMFLIIGVWGGKNKVYAAYKFFLYTLAGSVFMLIALLSLYNLSGGISSIPTLMISPPALPLFTQCLLFAGFFASFAIKMPLWPFHTWLPDAHVQAPTAGSVILAGVLLKMGGYGFIRFCLPILPDASAFFSPLMFTLGGIAIVYTSLIALVQDDIKKVIAYSSVAHMGFVTIGLFSGTKAGLDGAMFQMISHGLVASALFLCIGVLYERLKTRDISRYGAIVSNMPRFAALFMIFTLAGLGLPGTSGFIGEVLILIGAFQAMPFIAVVAGLGLILGAAYMLRLYGSVVFGSRENLDAACMVDLDKREIVILSSIAIIVLILGLVPSTLTHITSPSISTLISG